MTTLLQIAPYAALTAGAGMMARALHLASINGPQNAANNRRSLTVVFLTALLAPNLAHAATDLRAATEAGNAIIMYLSGTFAAVGIVAAGVLMMTGRQSIAKWAFAGAVVCGLAFAIVRTIWSNAGLEAANVGSFQ
jgi:hypothetical protein